jgi:hypothetical protein
MCTSVSRLVYTEIDYKVSFKLCSKVHIKGREFSCKVSNSLKIALCLFEITGSSAYRLLLVPSNAEIKYYLIKSITLEGILVTVCVAIALSHDSSKKC